MSTQAHVNLASLLHLNVGSIEDAVVHYRKAISLYANYCAARVNLGAHVPAPSPLLVRHTAQA